MKYQKKNTKVQSGRLHCWQIWEMDTLIPLGGVESVLNVDAYAMTSKRICSLNIMSLLHPCKTRGQLKKCFFVIFFQFFFEKVIYAASDNWSLGQKNQTGP